MIKAFFLIRRKAGITHEQFKERYESHARLAQKYIGHLMLNYVRNYPTKVRGSRSYGLRPVEWNYDVIGEWTLANEAALDEVYRIFKEPEIGKIFYDDEELFMDRESLVFITCQEDDILDTGTQPGGTAPG